MFFIKTLQNKANLINIRVCFICKINILYCVNSHKFYLTIFHKHILNTYFKMALFIFVIFKNC